MSYTLQLYSTQSVAVTRVSTGASMMANDPVSSAYGDAFSWQLSGDPNPSAALSFGTANASVSFDDGDGLFSSNPVANDTVQDQKLAATTTIDGTTYTANGDTVLWHSPAAIYVKLQYTVTLYDASGTVYTMAGVSVVQGWSPTVAGVAFIGAAPPAGTVLYYHLGQSTYINNPDAAPLTSSLTAATGSASRTPVPCFAADCRLETEDGPCPAGEIRAGMRVLTRDGGLQPVLWVGGRFLDAAALAQQPGLRPIRIRAGALGPGLPARDLVVSPQHRVLLRSKIAGRMFGVSEVLVPAIRLLRVSGVEVAQDMAEVHYVHLLLDRHHILLSEGLESESLYLGAEARKALSAPALEEVLTLFPELRTPGVLPLPARRLVAGGRARKLVERHVQNCKPLVA